MNRYRTVVAVLSISTVLGGDLCAKECKRWAYGRTGSTFASADACDSHRTTRLKWATDSRDHAAHYYAQSENDVHIAQEKLARCSSHCDSEKLVLTSAMSLKAYWSRNVTEANEKLSSEPTCECSSWGEDALERMQREHEQLLKQQAEDAAKVATQRKAAQDRASQTAADEPTRKDRAAANKSSKTRAADNTAKAGAHERDRQDAAQQKDDSVQQNPPNTRAANPTSTRAEEAARAARDARMRSASELVALLELQRYMQNQESIARAEQQRKEDQQRDAAAVKAAVVDPFGQKPAVPTGSAELIDPFVGGRTSGPETNVPHGGQLVDPFEHSAKPEVVEEGEAVAGAIIETRLRAIDDELSLARQTMSKSKYARVAKAAEETKSALSGFGHALSAMSYGQALLDIRNADTPQQRDEAAAGVAYKFATDAAAFGAERVLTKLFGAAAGVASGGVTTFLGEFFTSEETGHDPAEIIHDDTGHYSLLDKQRALGHMWSAYEHFGRANWGTEQKRQLMELTDRVYKDAGR